MDSIRTAFAIEVQGAWAVIINGGLLVSLAMAASVTVDRLVALRLRAQTDTGAFLTQVQKLVLSGDVPRAASMCAAAPMVAVAQVARAGLSRADQGPSAVQDALVQASAEVLRPLRRRLSWFAGMARVAALLTLAGTSLGAWHMLEAMKLTEDTGRLGALSAATAGTTVAASIGLLTIVLSLGGKVAFTRLLARISTDVETTSAKVLALLASRSPQARA
ncbi:MAG: MotA/TolQ/ExbB proton channel family protein [Myxococcales bacterium]|nr:MotA/TolQ/ExbB proton channel family protein [Myxococcales bacterium]